MKTCELCDQGVPLNRCNHVARPGRPAARCSKQIKRGDIAAFKEHLNRTHGDHGRDRFRVNGGPMRGATKRPYGDYLCSQDHEMFMINLAEWLVERDQTAGAQQGPPEGKPASS